MSNKRNKELQSHNSDSEEEQDSGSEKDSDVDSDGNYVGEKVRWRKDNLKTHVYQWNDDIFPHGYNVGNFLISDHVMLKYLGT